MSEIHRYSAIKLRTDGGCITFETDGPEVVLSSDFDTLAQRLQEAERLLNDVSCRGTLMAWEPGLVEEIDAFLAGKGNKP